MHDKIVREGQVTIKVPSFDRISSKAPVFYNPDMELNRDLSVLAIRKFQIDKGHEISICDVFGGSGIRGIRYAKEIEGVYEVTINDINPLATRFTKENVMINNLNNVNVFREDANIFLRKNQGKFDVVDIDPFGSPSYYVESAAVALKSGGMLCITATDTSSLCGTYKKPCVRKYNSMPLKTEYCHEIGMRILLGFIARTFAKYKKSIEVRFSHSTLHYMRAYMTIKKGTKITDKSLKDLGYILHCENCLYRACKRITPQIPQWKCPICAKPFKIAGPLWCESILDGDFLDGMLEIIPQIKINKKKEASKILKMCYDESNAPATYYDLHEICKKLKISVPPIAKVLETLKDRGYFASRTHFKPTGIKTDATVDVLDEIICHLSP